VDKSLYDVLGVGEDASDEDVRRAFRTLAKELHPDKNGGDDTRFKEVNMAYQVLSSPEGRSKYNLDQAMRRGPARSPYPGASPKPGGPSFEDLFEDLIAARVRRNPFSSPPPRPDPGEDVVVQAEITVGESVVGCKKAVRVTGAKPSVRCESCEGSGSRRGTPVTACPCVGRPGGAAASDCSMCGGRGTFSMAKCKACRGVGKVPYSRDVIVTIPAGISHGQELRVAGVGSPGQPPGDLFVEVRIRSTDKVWRDQLDVHIQSKISLKHAILGGQLLAEGPDGQVHDLEVPPGTQPGDQVRKKSCGAKSPLKGSTGDLVVHIAVQLPKSLSPRGRELLEELSEELSRGPLP
jgi:molecular chaperone DnaJ